MEKKLLRSRPKPLPERVSPAPSERSTASLCRGVMLADGIFLG